MEVEEVGEGGEGGKINSFHRIGARINTFSTCKLHVTSAVAAV